MHREIFSRGGGAVGKSVRNASERLFESKPSKAYVVRIGNDSFTAKRSATGVSVTGPRR